MRPLKPGEIVLASLDQLYLCADPACKAVSNSAERCPVCDSQVLSLGKLFVERSETRLSYSRKLLADYIEETTR
jgi:hypothetical protein